VHTEPLGSGAGSVGRPASRTYFVLGAAALYGTAGAGNRAASEQTGGSRSPPAPLMVCAPRIAPAYRALVTAHGNRPVSGRLNPAFRTLNFRAAASKMMPDGAVHLILNDCWHSDLDRACFTVAGHPCC